MLWFVAEIHSLETDASLHVNYATFVLNVVGCFHYACFPYFRPYGYGCGASKVVIAFFSLSSGALS